MNILKFLLFIRYILDHINCYLNALWIRIHYKEIFDDMIIWLIMVCLVHVLILFSHLLYIVYLLSICVLYYIYIRMLEGFPIDSRIVYPNTINFWRIDCNNKKTKTNNVNHTTIIGEWKGRRSYMEDRILDFSEKNIYGIFDGHGWSEISDYFKRNFKSIYDIFYK